MLQLLATTTPSTIPRACVAPHDSYPFCNPKLPRAQRLDDLIKRLTLEEKPRLLIARQSPDANISRLGIPEYDWGANCIHGVQSRCSADGRCPTSYPNPNTLGSTFNRTVWKRMGEVIGLELRALWLQGVGENHDSNLPHLGLDCWSPNIGIVRDPRWGRNLETPSEDPLVCGSFGADVTRGLQNGSDARYMQAVVTLKHFDANSLEGDWGPKGIYTRHSFDAKISQYDLFSTYLPAFKQAVLEGGARGVMCSYNAVNGVPSCANKWLLGDVLRKEWKFDGYVTSDSGAVADIIQHHHYTKNWTETVAKAMAAGCDVESASWPAGHPWSTNGPYLKYLPQAVHEGLIAESAIDAALRNALGLRFDLGLFDPIDDQPYWHVPPEVVQQPSHVALSVDSTRQGLVLLQNPPNVLPFQAGRKVAVVGPHTNDRTHILGNYLGQICNDSFSSRACVQTVYEAIESLNSQGGAAKGDTTNATGVDVNTTKTAGMQAALDAAGAADVVVFVGGLDTSSVEREGKDRYYIGLPGEQPKLLRGLLALGKPTCVVLFHGGIVTIPDDILSSPHLAVVSAGYPGINGGVAIAEALFDLPSLKRQAVNRWGRTPLTWYSEKGWAKADYDMLSFDMSAAPGRTYRYYDQSAGPPQWPFGFGLMYADWSKVTARPAPAGQGAVSLTAYNAGRDGSLVLLYFAKADPGTIPADEPASKLLWNLVHFERFDDVTGKKVDTSFTLTPAHVTMVDKQGASKLWPGNYSVGVYTGATKAGPTPLAMTFKCEDSGCVVV